MDLSVKDVAGLLNVSEATICKWIIEGKIPSYRMDQRHLFSREEIENWVISHKLDATFDGDSPFLRSKKSGLSIISSPKETVVGGSRQFSLFRALHKGDVLFHLKGKTKEEIFQDAMRRSSLLLPGDAEVISDLLLDREQLMPTALNNGIAVPHTRDAILDVQYDVVIVAFLEEPLEYGALDGHPVHTLFFLFASEDKRHLHLLAKIAHLSGHPSTQKFFQTHPSKAKLLAFIKEWESQIPQVVSRPFG